MNHNDRSGLRLRRLATAAALLLCGMLLGTAGPASAAKAGRGAARAVAGGPLAPCSSAVEGAPLNVTLGKYRLVTLPAPVVRLVRGDGGPAHTGIPADAAAKEAARAPLPGADTKTGVGDADVMLLSPSQLYVLGKRVGAMNLITQDRDGRCTLRDIVVTMDAGALQSKFAQVMPDERGIRVTSADDSLILSGEVADAVKVQRAMTLAAAYAPEKRVVNLLRATAASQVMLEVKVAEVSKTLLDKLGARAEATSGGSGWQYSLTANFLTDGTGLLQAFKSGKGLWQINGEKDDGVVRVLAEPNLMAISGQQASFLSGGKIFIPVAQASNGGFGNNTITLEEKEFGVGLKFVPTVLEGGRINLKVTSEVSELSQTGSPFTTIGGITAVLPSMTTRRADTSVQLRDGQSFAIAGLIKNNATESIKRFPGLGEIPLLGALFRSSEFQRDMTELLFIITPRLVKPLPATYALPTDNFKEPSRAEFLLGGKMEGSDGAPAPKPNGPGPQSGAPVSRADKAAPTQPSAPDAASADEGKPVAEPQPVKHDVPQQLPPPRDASAAVPAEARLRSAKTLASRGQ
ncbi:MAG TPA: pilus assembly protein N-terminal domain-containing protein [Rhodocyclaceae bacterium]